MKNINPNKTISFSFDKFRKFKKNLNIFLNEKYGETTKEIFSNKKTREAVFKYIFGFKGKSDIFGSGRTENIEDLNLSDDLIEIIENIKEHTKKILYSE